MPRPLVATALLAALAIAGPGSARAARWTVEPGSPPLREVLSRAAPGDEVVVAGGIHRGPFAIDRPLTLTGIGWPVLDAGGRGTVVSVTAPDVVVQGFEIRGSGRSLDQENSGLAFDEAPRGAVVGNRFRDVLFGIYLRRSSGSRVTGNQIVGKSLDLARRGDAIRVWYSNDVVIEGNRVEAARDLVLWYSERLTVHGNQVAGGRYGLHFMYCDDASIRENRLHDNSVGAFLMYSRRLRLTHNSIVGNHGPSGFGVGLKDMDDAEIVENVLVGNRIGLFLDNSPREAGSSTVVSGNLVAGNDVGISLLANVRRGRFTGNSLVENGRQVEIAGGGAPGQNRWHGNHWSDYAGFDAGGDGVGDLPHRVDRLFETLAGRKPALALFADSPLARALDYAARAFPLFRPRPLLVDEAPRMRPSTPAGAPRPPEPRGPGGGLLGAGLAAVTALLAVAPGGLARLAARRSPGEDEGRGRTPLRPVPAAPGAGEPPIRVQGLTKRFGRRTALDGVSFEVPAGTALALWGPNGAGKTTALRAVLGVIPVEGSVRVAGADPWREGRRARRRIGFVPQEIELQADLTVQETLRFFARLRGTDPARIGKLIRRIGLAEETGKRVGALSGGLKQRLALALALLADPPILVLDEPTSNLDAAARTAFLELLLQLKSEGRTLLFSSHRPEEVAALADRVLHLDGGRRVAETASGTLLANGRGETDLWLRVPESQRERARRHLEERGYRCRLLGAALVVALGRGARTAPLAVLHGAGIEVEEFQLQAGEARGGGGEA